MILIMTLVCKNLYLNPINTYEEKFLPVGGCLLGCGLLQGLEGAGLLRPIFLALNFDTLNVTKMNSCHKITYSRIITIKKGNF